MSARAELLADRGAAAESDDLFRCRAFLEAEGVTHTLRIESPDRTALVPLIVRRIEGGGRIDAISPYGYPGATVSGTGAAPADVDWSATGLVSVFGRERLAADPWLAGATERSRVLIHDPATERSVRPRLAEQIRANERDGWAVETIAGPDSADPDREAFAAAYEQTMRRAEAAERYFFGDEYFARILGFEASWLVSAVEPGGEVAAASIVARSDAMLHYYLSGTGDRFLSDSPMKNVVAAIVELATEQGLPLNLGGGFRPGDPLEEFKRGFTNRSEPFHSSEIVADPAAYERLSSGREAGGFFPAYRAPG